MENAVTLLKSKAYKLRERLKIAQEGLTKINNAGNEMDGNTTIQDEDELINKLKEKMPSILRNTDEDFEALDAIDNLIIEIIQTKNVEKISQLKKDVDDV